MRNDITQKLFKQFMKGRNRTPFVFSVPEDGNIVLTDDVFINALLQSKIKNENKRINVYKPLGLGECELSGNLILDEDLKHALMFEHKTNTVTDSTLVVSSSFEKLSTYLQDIKDLYEKKCLNGSGVYKTTVVFENRLFKTIEESYGEKDEITGKSI